MSSSKGNPAATPKYLNDFSKALANEVRILLAEVGKLRDERRALQYEIAELMSVKSKHGAGGEYTADWRPAPSPEEPPRMPSPAPPPPSSVLGDGPARPAWRVVNVRQERRQKAKAKALGPPPSAPPPAPAPPTPNLPAWAQWKPNALLSPQPMVGTSASPLPEHAAPPRMGLFGPPSPPPK
ncbi:uncharacterized protein LAESUDRAFT_811581 [Laetiporus sulphureus 93-53]|uniref:Uncharacterized protein n=1 Tax=Laetiporus sulphureus 93-53 TaxID=1314785 RepID=A0A165F031_9APHY|nr:uncharacterized protein LAESUDRAFT_811581 [Laetiporus sulphureus 93-53]KZT08085.1 hypothetical protein LAESUDRAFT_811581 [Laetiporus sulphureus 93-53]